MTKVDSVNRKQLTKLQRNLVLQWIMEGLSDSQIIVRAAEQSKPFSISRQAINKTYRRKEPEKIKQVLAEKEISALKQGLAIRENRVADLQKLRDKLIAEVDKSLWIDDSKTILTQNYETTEVKKTFNASLIRELRGVLDDAAREMGDRKGTPAINNYMIGDDALAALRKTYNLQDTLPGNDGVIEGKYADEKTD